MSLHDEVLVPGYAGDPVQIIDARDMTAWMVRMLENGLLAPHAFQRRLEDEYRTIKRPLIKNAALARDMIVPAGNLLMVASALSGEGKTFTCVNLSLSMAREKGRDESHTPSCPE